MTTTITTREPMQLSSQNVCAVFNGCLMMIPGDNTATIVNGVQLTARFNPERLENHRADIIAMLDHLPDEFHVGSGNGWTFLNMCIDRNGVQWTDLHEVCDMLLCLGIGIDAVEYTIKQRDLWKMFPGGMPYVTINTQKQ